MYEFLTSAFFVIKLLIKRPKRFKLWPVIANYLLIMTSLPARLNRGPGKIKLIGMVVCYQDYESFAAQFIENFIKLQYYYNEDSDRPEIIDAGANIGDSVLYFKYVFPRAKVSAFEPEPTAFKLLKENIFLNKLEDVKAYPFALGKKNMARLLYHNTDTPASSRSSLFSTRKWSQKTKVRCVKLSDYVAREVSLIKIDTEGAEQEILEDLNQANVLTKINNIIIEFHNRTDEKWHLKLDKILEIVGRNGYATKLNSTYIPYLGSNYQDILIYSSQRI